ncbi:MAG: hypothetical protein R3F56_06565 [Planctomycetota bacterium]
MAAYRASEAGARRDDQQILPRALFALLLAAAALILLPRWAEAILGPARWLMCLPLRALPAPALAGAGTSLPMVDEAALARLDHAALSGGRTVVADDSVPLLCRVLERRLPGAAGLPSLLVLDRTWDEIAGNAGIVTRDDCLIGVVGEPTDLEDKTLGGQAIVRCLHAAPRGAAPVRLLARTSVRGEGMRLVVEPASRIDPWPLRVPLLEDPYLAARLDTAGEPVFTCPRITEGLVVPDGLLLGSLRVWGYADSEGTVLPVGYFVSPACDVRALSTVVVWRRRTAAPARVAASAPLRTFAARALALPPSGERLYLTRTGAGLRKGAAVLGRDGNFYGVVVESGPGDGVAASFRTPGRAWTLLLVRDDGGAPVECHGRVRSAAGARIDLELTSAIASVTGSVLTGGNGMACPPGLRVGRIADVAAGGTLLRVERPHIDLAFVYVCAPPEAAR